MVNNISVWLMNTTPHAELGFDCILANLNPALNLNPLKSFGSVIISEKQKHNCFFFTDSTCSSDLDNRTFKEKKKFNTSCKFMGNMYWTVFCQGPVTSWCLLWLPGNRSWQGEVGHITTSASSVFVRIKQTCPLVSCRGVCKCVFPLEPQLFHPVSCTDVSVASTSSTLQESEVYFSYWWVFPLKNCAAHYNYGYHVTLEAFTCYVCWKFSQIISNTW